MTGYSNSSYSVSGQRGDDLTWSCHFCGRVRPDRLISVASRLSMIGGRVELKENRRYCNDSPSCCGRAALWKEEELS